MIIAKAQSLGAEFQRVECAGCGNKDVLIVFNEDDSLDVRCSKCGHSDTVTTNEGGDIV